MRRALASAARSVALLICAAAAAYLITIALTAQFALWLAEQVRDMSHPVLRVLIGVVALDLAKLVGLLPAAWALRKLADGPPLPFAAALVVLCFAFELAVAWIIQPEQVSNWTWTLWLIRLAALVALIWPVSRVLAGKPAAGTARNQTGS